MPKAQDAVFWGAMIWFILPVLAVMAALAYGLGRNRAQRLASGLAKGESPHSRPQQHG